MKTGWRYILSLTLTRMLHFGTSWKQVAYLLPAVESVEDTELFIPSSALSKLVLGSLTHLGLPYGYFMVTELPAAQVL